jgi:hypothetical protein
MKALSADYCSLQGSGRDQEVWLSGNWPAMLTDTRCMYGNMNPYPVHRLY